MNIYWKQAKGKNTPLLYDLHEEWKRVQADNTRLADPRPANPIPDWNPQHHKGAQGGAEVYWVTYVAFWWVSHDRHQFVTSTESTSSSPASAMR